MASSEAELKDQVASINMQSEMQSAYQQVQDSQETEYQSQEPESPRRWANVVTAGVGEQQFPDVGYMSQASSVMEMDGNGYDGNHSCYGQQWEWVDHFEDGMVFVCTSGTFDESMKRMLLGLPKQYMFNLKKLTDRSHIFLFNKTTKMMHAGFHPAGEADWNVCPQAFTPIRRDANGVEKRQPPGSKYPAQMAIAVFRHLEPLPEIAFKGVLKDPRKPKLLKRAHVRQLLRIFQKATAPAGAEQPMPAPAPAFIRLTTPTGSDTEPAMVYPTTPGPILNTHFLAPPIAVSYNGLSPTHSRAGSVSSFNSPSPSVAFSGSNNSCSPHPQPITVDFRGHACFPVQSYPVSNYPAPLGPIPMPLTESKFDASQKFKMRSTDALKRLQSGNIRPVNHLFNSLYDQITTLQVQLQQQQLIINNLSYQVSQQRNQLPMVPIYPTPQGAQSPQQTMSPVAQHPANYSPPNQPTKVIPLSMHIRPVPQMNGHSHFNKNHMMHNNGFYQPRVHHVAPTMG